MPHCAGLGGRSRSKKIAESSVGCAGWRTGVGREQAQEDVARLLPEFLAEYPTHLGQRAADAKGMRLVSYHRALVGGESRALWLLMGAAGFVLLIACANVAGPLLARGNARKSEIAIRRRH